MIPRRSDIALASAERLAESGVTDTEMAQRVREIGQKLAPAGMVLINLRDAGLTQSQYDRAVRLGRELYPQAGGLKL